MFQHSSNPFNRPTLNRKQPITDLCSAAVETVKVQWSCWSVQVGVYLTSCRGQWERKPVHAARSRLLSFDIIVVNGSKSTTLTTDIYRS